MKWSGVAAIVAFAAVALGPWLTPDSAHAASRPNVLLILADDMGYSDISPYGSEIFTPNLARLADQGIMFTDFHVAAYCAPTRSMVMTGVDNHIVGLGNMIELVYHPLGLEDACGRKVEVAHDTQLRWTQIPGFVAAAQRA